MSRCCPGPLSDWTFYHKISFIGLDAARFVAFILFQSLWCLPYNSATALLRHLSNFRAIRWSKHQNQRLRNFTRSCGKTSFRLVNKCPGDATLKITGKWMIALRRQQHRYDVCTFHMVHSMNKNWLNTQWLNEGGPVWTCRVAVHTKWFFEKCLRAQLLSTGEWIRQMTSSTLISEQYCVKDYHSFFIIVRSSVTNSQAKIPKC